MGDARAETGGYGGMRVAARAYKGCTSSLKTVGNLHVTPVFMQDGRYLPEVTISKKDCRAQPSTYSPAVFTKDGRRAPPSLPTLPGTDGTDGAVGNTGKNTRAQKHDGLGEPSSKVPSATHRIHSYHQKDTRPEAHG